MSSDQMKWLMMAAKATNPRDFEIAMHRTRMTPEQMLQKYMEMSRFMSRQSISQSLPGRALGAIAQGGASLASAGASSAASAVARAAPVVARALSSAPGRGLRATRAAGSSAVRAASAGVRRGAALTSAVGRAAAQMPSRIMSDLLQRDIDDAELLTAPRPRRRDGARVGDRRDVEDLRARVMRQAMA
jgi:hypothetical protein